MFFLPSEYLCTPSVEENIIQLLFSTVTFLPKNKFFDKKSGVMFTPLFLQLDFIVLMIFVYRVLFAEGFFYCFEIAVAVEVIGL